MTVKLLKSSAIVSVMTFFSRIMGLVRDVIIAVLFGAEANTDAYFVAQKIPNFLRRLFAEGAFSQAFIPVLAETKAQGDFKAVQQLVNRVAGTLGCILLLVTVPAVLGSAGVIAVFSPGFYLAEDPSKYLLATDLLKITFPYLFFIALTAFAGAVLNTYDRFAVPAITPIFLNICIILGALAGSHFFAEPTFGLAWGVLVAGIVQLAFQLPFLWRLNLMPRPQIAFGDARVKQIMALMLPGIFGVSVSQINLMIDTQIASFLDTGSITWLYLSDRLLEFPLGVFGIAIATVILPALSRHHATSSIDEFRANLNWGLRLVLLIGLPATVGLIVLAEPMVLTLFQYQNFTVFAAHQASLSLVAYAAGLLPFMFIKVLAPAYFARQDTKTPVRVGIFAMVSNIVFNLLLFIPFGHVGLAAATSLSALINAGLLYRGLKRKSIFQLQGGWWKWGLQLSFAGAAMVLVLVTTNAAISDWQAWSVWERIGHLGARIVLAAAVYLASLWLVGVRPRHLMGKSLAADA